MTTLWRRSIVLSRHTRIRYQWRLTGLFGSSPFGPAHEIYGSVEEIARLHEQLVLDYGLTFVSGIGVGAWVVDDLIYPQVMANVIETGIPGRVSAHLYGTFRPAGVR